MTMDTSSDHEPIMDPGLASPPAADEETPYELKTHNDDDRKEINGRSATTTKKSASSSTKNAGGGAASSSSTSKKSKSSKKQKEPPREMNAKFQDVQESGSWGKPISTKEKYVVIGIFTVLVIGAIVAVAVVLTTGGDKEPEIITPAPRPTEPPTSAPTEISDDKLLAGVLDNIYEDDYTTFIADALPLKASEYEGLVDDPNATPQEKAMSWLLYEDEWEFSADATMRWAMASIFYQMGGPDSWTKSEGWLSSNDLCEWEGISCEPTTGNVRELDLQLNQVIGTIPSELHLLPTLQSILMQRNELAGTIPGPMLGDMPYLSILSLADNKLTGTVPTELLGDDPDNSLLNSLFVQFNDLTGDWPSEYCPASFGAAPRPIERIGLDCDEVACLFSCCDDYDCYYDVEEEP